MYVFFILIFYTLSSRLAKNGEIGVLKTAVQKNKKQKKLKGGILRLRKKMTIRHLETAFCGF